MVNRDAALEKIDRIKNSFKSLKSTVYRGRIEAIEEQIDYFEELIEDLESLISVEKTEDFTRPYRGL